MTEGKGGRTSGNTRKERKRGDRRGRAREKTGASAAQREIRASGRAWGDTVRGREREREY